MSDPMNLGAPTAKARPASVTVSSYLLLLVAALQVIGSIVALSTMGTTSHVLKDAYAGTNLEGSAATIVTVSSVVSVVYNLLVATGFVVLALLNNKGKNVARIITWALGGIFLCCTGFGLVGQAVGNSLTMGNAGGNVPSQRDVREALTAALPSWYLPVLLGIGILTLLAVIAALVLLALPPSNEFFRKPQPAWEPPLPGSTYPAYPAYPSAAPPATGPTGPPVPPAPPSNPPPG